MNDFINEANNRIFYKYFVVDFQFNVIKEIKKLNYKLIALKNKYLQCVVIFNENTTIEFYYRDKKQNKIVAKKYKNMLSLMSFLCTLRIVNGF